MNRADRACRSTSSWPTRGRLNIERIGIVPDHIWPQHERFPVEPIHSWLQAQHQHNIIVKLVRQSSVADEPDLITDLSVARARGPQNTVMHYYSR